MKIVKNQKLMKKMSKKLLVYIIDRNKIRHNEIVVLFSVSSEVNKIINIRIVNTINSMLISLDKKLDFVTKKMNQIYQLSSFVSFRFFIYM
jgi:hypothetical protein